MLHIAICDDTPEEKLIVTEYATDYFQKKHTEAVIDTYDSMNALLETRKSYDLYLLDVIMPGISGIDGAASLGCLSPNPVIIFITSSLESAVDGYRVNASGFILKPVLQTDFIETLDRVCTQRLHLQKEYLSVMHNRVPLQLPLNKVLYFENKLHRVYAILADGTTISISRKLSELQDEIGEHTSFLRCHQSYLVNLTYVSEMEDCCFIMTNKALIPISRNFYKQSKNAYYHYKLN